MQPFMVFAAEGLQCAEPEPHRIAVVILDVMNDDGGHGAAFELAQRA
jgi:hypothetical protein